MDSLLLVKDSASRRSNLAVRVEVRIDEIRRPVLAPMCSNLAPENVKTQGGCN
jgi:hypothetical protein